MKKKHKIQSTMRRSSLCFLLAIMLISMASCNKQLDEFRPHNVIFEEQQFNSPDGFTKAVVGVYRLIAVGNVLPPDGSGYTDRQIFLSEAKGNTIRALDAQINRNTDVFGYVNSSRQDLSHTFSYWRNSYNTLLHINTILANIDNGETNAIILQAKAESLFLRAYIYFNLVRLYGMPYYQDPSQSLGVMLILTNDIDPSYAPARSNVSAVYQQIIADLQASIPLFQLQKTNSYASRYAAEALLSRVELYKGGTYSSPDQEANQHVVDYANRVIQNGGYRLLQEEEYKAYYNTDNIHNEEDIFAINGEFMNGTIASLWKMPSQILYTGGLYRPSPYLLSLMEDRDYRWAFYTENTTPGFPEDNIAVNKYSIEFNTTNSRSPYRYLRLAEVYLNRAEALVKLGRDGEALSDVNVIRRRAGLNELTHLSGEALFLEILKQRKIELAFEGHASYVEFRYGLDMVRNYASGRSGAMTVKATDPRILMKIPAEEIADNNNLDQNP